ncbi:MAG: hypothetical protein J6S53_05280 [Lentisphaeria bacterium]|nr:hypothetical protein [Lentisphaeria bacterium]
MPLKKRRAQRKVDYAASIEDRKRLAAYISKNHFHKTAGKKFFSPGEKTVRFIVSLLGAALFLTGLYFVIF